MQAEPTSTPTAAMERTFQGRSGHHSEKTACSAVAVAVEGADKMETEMTAKEGWEAAAEVQGAAEVTRRTGLTEQAEEEAEQTIPSVRAAQASSSSDIHSNTDPRQGGLLHIHHCIR
jgi:hypothetical protein